MKSDVASLARYLCVVVVSDIALYSSSLVVALVSGVFFKMR